MTLDQAADSGLLWEDFQAALFSERASATIVRQIEKTFEAVLEGHESFRPVSLLLPDLINSIFGFQDRGRSSWPERQSGWLQDCERRGTPTKEAEALEALLGPQHALYRTLHRYDERYVYEFPLRNLPQPLLDEIAGVVGSDLGFSGNESSLSTNTLRSQVGERSARAYSPLAHYLAARLAGAPRDTVRVGAARYYLLCFLAYPVYVRQAPAIEMQSATADAPARRDVYDRVLLAFLHEFLPLDSLLSRQVSFDPSAATQLSAADLFLHALLSFWFHWNGELGPWQGWHDPTSAAWSQPPFVGLRDGYKVPSLATIRCQRLVVLHVLQTFVSHRDQVIVWAEHLQSRDRNLQRGAEARIPGDIDRFDQVTNADDAMPRMPSAEDTTNLLLRLDVADEEVLALPPSRARSSESFSLTARTNTELRFLLVMFCRYLRRTTHRLVSLCVDLDVAANIAFAHLIISWLFPWDHIQGLQTFASKMTHHRERRSAFLSGLALLQAPLLEEVKKPSQYRSEEWQVFLALHFPLYLKLLSGMLRFLVRSRCLLQSPRSLEVYLDLYRGMQSTDWLTDARELVLRGENSFVRPSRGVGTPHGRQRPSRPTTVWELAALERDAFRQNLRELRIQLEKRLLSSWNAAIGLNSRAVRERAERLIEPWIRLFEQDEAGRTTAEYGRLWSSTQRLSESANQSGIIRRHDLLSSGDGDTLSFSHFPPSLDREEQERLTSSMPLDATTSARSEPIPLGTQIALGQDKCSNLDIAPRGDVWQWPKQSNEFGPALAFAQLLSRTLEQHTGVRWNLRWMASYVAIAYLGLGVILILVWLGW